MKKQFSSAILMAFIVFLFCSATSGLQALEQLQNRDFSNATLDPPWGNTTPVVQDNALAPFSINGGNFRVYFAGPGGSANLWDNADGLINQNFSVTASDTYARIGLSYQIVTGSNGKFWKYNFSGNVISNNAPGDSLSPPVITLADQGINNQTIGWTTPASTLILVPGLSGSNQYRLEFYWNFGCQKQTSVTGRIDNISCNLSPSGLTASETADGDVFLNWNDSTSSVVTLTSYKIYRKTSLAAPWGAAYATSATSQYTDLNPPVADEVFYAVSDVDNNTVESPLSVYAVYRRAKLEITSIETIPDNVTIGQTVLPVNVIVKNTGLSPARLEEVSLYFQPGVGNYTQTLSSSLPVNLAGGESTTVAFSVLILNDSIPGYDTINAMATGTSLVYSPQVPDDLRVTQATITDAWVIRSPANLAVSKITVPGIVYRDQKDVMVSVTVINDDDKNAAGYLDSLDLRFDHGLYENIRLIDSLPVAVYAEVPVTVNYLVDVNAFSATGTCEINADVYFRDINLLSPSTNFEDAIEPGIWTVVAGVMKTFKGPPLYPSYVIESNSFNVGSTIVYAKTENLLPLTEQRFRWYDPDGGLPVRVTDPPQTTDENGVMTDQLSLNAGSKLGMWRVIATRVTNDTPLAEAQFFVVQPAAISISHQLPATVTLGQTFTATSTINNSGGADVSDAFANTIEKLAGAGNATLVSGPSPDTATVPGLGQQSFNWQLNADATGGFTIQGAGYGFDANDSTYLTAATTTSGLCTVQTKPVLSIVSLTETYTNVYLNQQNLLVNMVLRNTGEAAVYVNTASLSFNVAGTPDYDTYSFEVVSPALPFVLDNSGDIAVQFSVDTALTSANAGSQFSLAASFTAVELNDPTAIYENIAEATINNAWTLNSVAGKCAGRADFNPEQYNFSLGQHIWVTFEGMPLPVNYYKVEIYDSSGTQTGYSSGIGAHSVDFDLAPGDPTGAWRALLTRVNNPGGAGRVVLAEQFFTVQAPGQLSASLKVSPQYVELGDNITVTMSLSNPVLSGSEIYPATSSLPLALSSAGYSGAAGTLISGPEPASASIKYGFPATFTWVFKTTTQTNIGDFFAMNAQATGIDINTKYVSPPTVVTSNSATSNDILILNREVSITPDPLDLGIMLCGAEQDFNLSILNTGNTHFQRLTWQKSYPTSAENVKIPYAYFNYFPANGFAIATGTSPTAGFVRFKMPLNQKAGAYTTDMTIFDDLNGDGIFQPGDNEPYYDFAFTVIASECRVVLAAQDIINLGGYPYGENTSSATIEILNGGNLNLDNLKFKAGAKTFTNSVVTIIPGSYSDSLATDSYFTASVSAYIGAGDALGNHIATFTIWDDRNGNGNIDAGEAADDFQILFSIGEKDFTVTNLDMGNATPTYTLMNFTVTIDNSAGTIGLVNPAAIAVDLTQGASIIPAEYVTIETPNEVVPAGETRIATITVYVPAGTPPGPYSGIQYIYDDENGDDIWANTVNEKRAAFNLSLTVNPYYAIQTIPSTVDLGGITPGEPPKEVGFLCRNVGNLALDKLTWQETSLAELSNPAQIIDVDKYFISPTPYFTANLGTTFYATVTIELPLGYTGGFYTGDFGWLYNDDAIATTSDYFTLSCQVGSKKIEFIESGPLLATGTPNSTSTSASFRVKNTGTLVLAKPRIMAITDLTDSTGPYTIPAAACVFNPSTFDFMAQNQIKTGAWSAMVPTGQQIGTYTGTIKVWDDTNNNFIPDATEASDTIDVELRVTGKLVLTVTSNPADFFYVPAGSSGRINLILKNAGNLPVNEFSELNKYVRIKLFPLNPLSPGPPGIPSTSLEFSPSPLATTMPVNGTVDLIATITVPAGQTTGPYEGNQIIYYDRDKDGEYDAGSEESVTLLLKVNVNAKSFIVTTPVNMGSGNPSIVGTPSNLTKSFVATNLSSIPLSKLKWFKVQLVNGSGDIIPTSAFSFLPAGPFNISSGGNKTVSASLTIPLYQAPGTYVATQTLYEDEDGGNDIDLLDASATFKLAVTVNSYPNLSFTVNSLNAGNLNTGETSSVFNLYFTNTGNEPLSALTTLPYSLSGPTSTLDSSLINLSIATAAAGILNPGVTALAELTIGPIPSAQVAETYNGNLCIYDSVKTSASDSISLSLTVVEATTGLDISSGTIYQEIATLTFNDTTDERFIFSAWVCPGTSTTRLGFVESLNDGTIVNTIGIEVDSNGQVTGVGAVVASGLSETAYFDHSTYGMLPWYRVYFAFDYHFDAASADKVHLILQNVNSDPLNKAAVWFDGIQLEKPVFQEKTEPAGFTRKQQLISPSKELDISGNSNYHEW